MVNKNRKWTIQTTTVCSSYVKLKLELFLFRIVAAPKLDKLNNRPYGEAGTFKPSIFTYTHVIIYNYF